MALAHTHCPLTSTSEFLLSVPVPSMSSSPTIEQFAAATTQVVQQLEALAQRVSLCRQAFREGLAARQGH